MQEFKFRAKNKEGEEKEGYLEAESVSVVSRILVEKGFTPIDIAKRKNNYLENRKHRISVKEKTFFIRQLAAMINAGLPVSQSLQALKTGALSTNLSSMIEKITKDVEGGSQLSAAFANFPNTFKKNDTSLIASGEASGNLDKTLLYLADQTEKNYHLNKKVQGAFYYPAFIATVAFVVMIIITLYVMPQMELLYTSFDAKLPWVTRLMIGFSHVLINYGVIILVLVIAALVSLRSFISQPKGRMAFDMLKLRIPLIKDFLTKIYSARFSRTLAGLVNSGVPILDSLKIVSDVVGNVAVGAMIVRMMSEVKEGKNLSDVLKKTDYFPGIVSQMIAVGEKTGELGNMLESLAKYYEDEVEESVKNFSTLLEPIIIVFLAVVVGFLIMAIMLPIYNIGKVIAV